MGLAVPNRAQSRCFFAPHNLLPSLLLMLAACQDRSTAEPLVSAAVAVPTTAGQPAALERLANGLALALHDSATRVRFKERLRHSRLVEHKVFLRDILRGSTSDDSALLARMAAALSADISHLRELAVSLPEIEVYLPVKRHRGTWTGIADVIVVAALSETAAPIAFGTDGSRAMLSFDTVPNKPAIVLTRKEARTGDTLGVSVSPETARQAELMAVSDECEPVRTPVSGDVSPAYYTPPVCDGGYVPPPPPLWPQEVVSALPNRSGIYLQAARIYDNHEPWIRGDPELEFSVQLVHSNPVERSRDNFEALVPVVGIKVMPTQCSGRRSPDPMRTFDFNEEDGARYTQNVLLMDPRNTVVRETIVGFPSFSLLLDRDAPLRYPVTLTLLERDDGEECPTPAKELVESGWKLEVKVKLGLDGSIKGWSAKPEVKDVLALFGIVNNNDIIWSWTFSSWDELRVLNKTKLASNEADLWVTTSSDLRTCIIPPAPFGTPPAPFNAFVRPCN